MTMRTPVDPSDAQIKALAEPRAQAGQRRAAIVGQAWAEGLESHAAKLIEGGYGL